MCLQGECDGPPSEVDLAVLDNTPGAAQLLPFQDRQCLIMTNGELLPIMSYRCAAVVHVLSRSSLARVRACHSCRLT